MAARTNYATGFFALRRRTTIWIGIGLIASAVTAGAVFASSKPNASKLRLHPVAVEARAIRSFSKSARTDRFGRLRFRGGLVLRASDPAFGGFSGLEISSDGRAIFAVSDAGAWLKARLSYEAGRPARLSNVMIGPIKALADRDLSRGRDRDAEAIRLLSGDFSTGTVLIGFESNHRIGLFALANADLKPPRRYLRPPRSTRLRRNKSIEAVAVIRKGPLEGAIVAFAEQSLDPNGHHRGWIWRKPKSSPGSKPAASETVAPIALTNIRDFDITDAVGAPDGGTLHSGAPLPLVGRHQDAHPPHRGAGLEAWRRPLR